MLLLISFIFASGAMDARASNFGLPLVSEASPFYYVPQSKLKSSEKGILKRLSSYSDSGSHFGSWLIFSGCRSCELENIILVNKKTKAKKSLFENDGKITSFYFTSAVNLKKKIPPLLFIAKEEAQERTDFYIAKLDGSNLRKISPEGFDVVDHSIDTDNKKLFLLLRKMVEKPEQVEPTLPYMVDLEKLEVASPLLGN